MSYIPNTGEITIPRTSAAADAFGRQRMSQAQTLFDSKLIHDAAPQFWDDQEVSGSGTTSTYNSNQASVTMAVSGTTIGKRVRQTYQRFNYQPGKSQLVIMTGVLGSVSSGIDAKVGWLTDDNGLFFYRDSSTIGVCIRSNATGSPVDNPVPQSGWTWDTLDGSGDENNPSGIQLDPDKVMIYFWDVEWLGVGSVRFGVFIDGVPHYVHQFDHANNITTVYMSTPNLPLRWEIENDGTGAADELVQICSTVISEGSTQATGQIRYKSTEGTHMVAGTENTLYALMGARLKSDRLDGIVEFLSHTIDIQSTGDAIEWQLLLNPTVAGTFNYSAETNSVLEIAIGAAANSVTGGTAILGGYFRSGGGNSGQGANAVGLNNAIRLGAAIDGTPDEFVLCARPIDASTNVSIETGITWREP